MVGKKSGKALLREEGLERTDNGMKQSSWPEPTITNQKNYYTTYMKEPHQILSLRLQQDVNRNNMVRNAKDRDRDLARTGSTDVPVPEDDEDEEGTGRDTNDASKIIIIHPGSQNLRIGFASDSLPKTIPFCIAHQWRDTETDVYKPLPIRAELSDTPEEWFGEEFTKKFTKVHNEMKVAMRARKVKVLPNSRDLVIKFNGTSHPEKIPEHNDPIRIEWTEVSMDDGLGFIGLEAQRVPFDATVVVKGEKQKYRLRWPIRHGWLNEHDFGSADGLTDCMDNIFHMAMTKELGVSPKEFKNYSCVFVIPDLYDKKYVEAMLESCLKEIEFKQVAFIQEGLAATYGAGYPLNCLIDIGAQKTSISCIEDGMIIEDSRINLKFGGYDVTETLVKMMLCNSFPYRDIDLVRRHDFLLAEEQKIKVCTMYHPDIYVQNQQFHLRAPNRPTFLYKYKTYDEPILAPLGFFEPSLFYNKNKLVGRRKLFARSTDAYDVDKPNDPESTAQLAILASIKPSLINSVVTSNGNDTGDFSTPQKERPNPFNHLSHVDSQTNGDSRVTSAATSPAPEGADTPNPMFQFGTNGANGGSPAPNGGAFQFGNGSHSGTPGPAFPSFTDPLARTAHSIADERDSVLAIAPLDSAIITSITHATKGDETGKKARDFFGNILVIGGGAKTPGLTSFLEEKLKLKRPELGDKILVSTSPRDLDNQVVVWKGAAVYAQLTTHESWIGQLEFERLGSRALHNKVLWNY
ncbi:hypothetical protein B0O99DRAFT_665292 [Bisporella sp. PMI_857]|nr:hypothetical protein B0O99DRAFT_665292 [Bisporella sp. PMI_857]